MRILLIENIQAEFRTIKSRLEQLFQNQIEVLPHDTAGNDYNDHNKLIKAFKIGEKSFTDIYNFFGRIDLYILDVSLHGNQDNRGIEFFKFLKDESDLNFAVIFISQSPKGSLPLPADEAYEFISKRDYGREFPNQVASKVADVLELNF